MYSRESNRLPVWLAALLAVLLVFGGCYLWRGFVGFFESGGNIAAPITSESSQSTAFILTQTSAVVLPPATLNALFGSPTAVRPCLEFYVTVVRARVRECPKESCETIELPVQNAIICVYGPAKDAPDWYEVNLEPKDPIARIGYMHSSVIYPRNPTPRPTATPRPTRTFTPGPTLPAPTAPSLPTVTPVPPAAPAPTETPRRSVQGA